MSYFKQIQNWLKNKGIETQKTSPTNPVEHKVIERSAQFSQKYDNWLISGGKDALISQINKDLLNSMLEGVQTSKITVLDSPGAKGFSIDLDDNDYTHKEWDFLLDYIASQVRDLEYICYNSDVRVYEKSYGLNTIYRHYLKPKFRHSDQFPVSQAYGNLLIELHLKDNEYDRFKFLATTYSDSKFQDPLSYTELLDQVLR